MNNALSTSTRKAADFSDVLPVEANRRLGLLRRHSADLHSLLRSASDARQQAREERDRGEIELHRLKKFDDKGLLIRETPIPARDRIRCLASGLRGTPLNSRRSSARSRKHKPRSMKRTS